LLLILLLPLSGTEEGRRSRRSIYIHPFEDTLKVSIIAHCNISNHFRLQGSQAWCVIASWSKYGEAKKRKRTNMVGNLYILLKQGELYNMSHCLMGMEASVRLPNKWVSFSCILLLLNLQMIFNTRSNDWRKSVLLQKAESRQCRLRWSLVIELECICCVVLTACLSVLRSRDHSSPEFGRRITIRTDQSNWLRPQWTLTYETSERKKTCKILKIATPSVLRTDEL